MLSPYRVLDLTDERGLLCGQILADLGADVIAVEPPGGSSARRIGPFAGDVPGPERSLLWWAYARNKRGISLDLDSDDGREQLRRLVAGADFLIESAAPGAMAAHGLGYDDLAAINPALVYVSITPFGQDGPKAHYAATDLTILAAGGVLALQGDEDRPPVRVSVPQAWAHAGAEAAGATLIAHHERERSGRGQHVDVSAQQAVMKATFSTALVVPLGEPGEATRVAGGFRAGPILVRFIFDARDGHVSLNFAFGTTFGPMTHRLMQYIYEEGFCDEETRDKNWVEYPLLLASGAEPLSELDRLFEVVEAFTRSKTKSELFQAALERRLLIAPVVRIDELAASEQLAAREYWHEAGGPTAGIAHRYPGPFARFSQTPICYRRQAPAAGEHNDEVLRAAAAPPRPSRALQRPDAGEATRSPLDGVKIVDLMWSVAGPAASRVLADYGATVVRVESTTRIDVARTLGPRHEPAQSTSPGPENSGAHQNMSAGKLGMTLDLTRDEGRAVLRDLVRWADVVMEAYTPHAMRAWGCDYRALRGVKPDIIMLSTCLMGQTGPLANYAGFGNLASAMSGFYEIAGWPDRSPSGPFGAYSDTVSPRFTVTAVLAALDHWRRTGEGQYIDQSQAEATLHFLTAALLDYGVNGRVQGRVGNRDPHMAPHGVYPAAGDDRWVAIAVTDDSAWVRLCEVLGQADLAQDERFVTLAARLAHHDELDAIVSVWTRRRDMHQIEALLQLSGVAASAVQNSRETYADAQLWHRGHFVELKHPIHGTTTVESSRFRLSRTPARYERCGPTLGRDNSYVLETILGYDANHIAELAAAGVLE